MKAAMVLALIVVVGISRINAQQDEATFTVYRDEESLTMLFLGSEPIPFHSIRLDVYLSNDTVTEIFLQDYSTFRRSLPRDPLRPPTCLRLELRDSDLPFPSDCRLLTSPQRRVEDNLGRIDIFWYDDEINEYYDLEFFQADTFIGACAADQVENKVCEITFTPDPMPILPMATLRATVPAVSVQSQPTAAPVIASYPCPATISSAYGTAIQDLRPFNNANASTLTRQIIRAGMPVLVLAPPTDGITPLYRIADISGRDLGWITTIYVQLSTSCPAD